jgi:hypothetical protein
MPAGGDCFSICSVARLREHRCQCRQNDTSAVNAGILRHKQHDRGNGPWPCDHRHGHREDGNVLNFGRVDDFLRALLAPFGTLFKNHFDGDQEQHDAACNPEAVQFDMQRAQQLFAEQCKDQQYARCDDDGTPRHIATLRRISALG